MKILNAPISSGSIVEDIVRRLEHAILAGELVPGERLAEQALARQLGVSRGALREALRQLEGRKLIERTANVGARIAVLSDEQLVDIFQLWEAVGSLASRLAAGAARSKHIKELREIVSSYENAGDHRRRYFDVNFAFHSKIAELSNNARLRNLCSELFDLLHLYRFKLMSAPFFFERAKQAVVEQSVIVDAIAARDPVRAEQAMREHLANNLRFHRNLVRQAAQSSADQ